MRPPTTAKRWLPALVLACLAGCGDGKRHHSERKLVILGIDGMDLALTREYMAQGRLPNLAKLAAIGGFVPLGTAMPPQSPVAWAHVITGAGSEVHGIYDFIHRDPKLLGPYLSTSRVEAAEELNLLGWHIPLGSPAHKLLREGDAFWELLDRQGVPATVVKMPSSFPPRPAGTNEILAGMGTPDIKGTYGIYQVFTDDPAVITKGKPPSGVLHELDFHGGSAARSVIEGMPTGTSTKLGADGEPVGSDSYTLDVEIVADREAGAAMVQLGDQQLMLEPGEWSPWVQLRFDEGAISSGTAGMVRVYLRSVEPHVFVYVSPVNIDPIEPMTPISSPEDYARQLALDAGRFYTESMPEDTKALAAGILTDDEFLAQSELIFDESVRALDRELARFDGGALFVYFSSIDLTCHMFFRALAPDANEHDRSYAAVIPDLYARIDTVVGQVMAELPDDATLVVMSDHGFAPFRSKVNLNTWLVNRGYLVLQDPDAKDKGQGQLAHIDWDNTQAYQLGFNQIFINLQGREAYGAVAAEDRDLLVDRLARDLEGLRDPETGASVVTRVYRPERGRFPNRSPDLLVGFARGYRSSDESAQGIAAGELVTRNTDKWSGDHMMDPSHVPGVLLSNRALVGDPQSLTDIAPTVLRYFDLPVPPQMQDRSVFAPAR